MSGADDLAATVRFCLDNVPALLNGVECMLDAHEHTCRTADNAPDGTFTEVLDEIGANDLADALMIIAGRILTQMVGSCTWTMGEEPWRADEAAAAVAALTARHGAD